MDIAFIHAIQKAYGRLIPESSQDREIPLWVGKTAFYAVKQDVSKDKFLALINEAAGCDLSPWAGRAFDVQAWNFCRPIRLWKSLAPNMAEAA
jgi:hypothetical protein